MSSEFQPSPFEHLLEEARYNDPEEWQTFVVLLPEEVNIKSDIVYCKQMLTMCWLILRSSARIRLPAHLILQHTCLPLWSGEFPSVWSTHQHIFPAAVAHQLISFTRLFWDGVRHLEGLGFKVSFSKYIIVMA